MSAVGIAARLFGVPVLVAAVALAAFGSHARQPSGAQSTRATKPHSGQVPRPGVHQAPGSHPGQHGVKPTIVGSWYIANGIFAFHWTVANTLTDTVISQRPGVFCPRVNDHDGQMVLHRVHGSAHGQQFYVGTWAWYYVNTCELAGYGRLTVTLWSDGNRATFVAYAPQGFPWSRHMFLIDRVS